MELRYDNDQLSDSGHAVDSKLKKKQIQLTKMLSLVSFSI